MANKKIKQIKLNNQVYDIAVENIIQKVDTIEDVKNSELNLFKYTQDSGDSSPIVEVVSEFHEGSEGHNYTKITTDNNKTLSDVLSQFDSSITNFVSISDPVQIYSACYTYNNEQVLNGIRLGSSKNQGSFTITLTQECQLIANKYFAINGSTGEVASSDANSQIIVDGTVHMLAGEEGPVSITVSEGTHTISSGSGSSSRCFILGFTFSGESFYTYEKKHLARQEDLIDLTNVVAETNTAITALEKSVTTNAQNITAVDAKIGEVQIYNAKPYLPKASTDYLDKIYRYENILYQCLKTGNGEHKEFSFALSGTSEIKEDHLENIYRELGIREDENFIALSALSKVFRNNDSIKLGSSSSTGYFDLDFINEKPVTALKIGLRAYNTKNSVFYISIWTQKGSISYDYSILVNDSTTEKLVDLYQYIRNSGASNEEIISGLSIYTQESITDEETGETTYADPRGCITRIIADFGDVTYEWAPVSSTGIQHVTYTELKDLRDNSKLVPGQQYRIIDYITTTTQKNTQSAGHQFDIIVTADSENTLNENARAAIHEGDDYFQEILSGQKVVSASWKAEITVDDVEVLYHMREDPESFLNYDPPITYILDMSTYINNDGIEVPSFRDIDPESNVCYINTFLPIEAVLSDDNELLYDSVEAWPNHKDVLIDLGYNEDDQPILYKHDPTCKYSAGLDNVDYEEYFLYEGDIEWEGETHNLWVKYEYNSETDELAATRYKILTRVVVVDNQFTITQEELRSGIQLNRDVEFLGSPATYFYIGTTEIDGEVYDKWQEAEIDDGGLYYRLTNRVVEAELEDISDLAKPLANLAAWEIRYCLDNDTDRFAWANSTNGKGVIYYMKDEFNNECPYDFKNILFTGSSADGSVNFTNAYTFTYTENSELKDASLVGLTNYCYNNVIKEYYSSNKVQLNYIIFYSTSTGFRCYSNTFGSRCNYNTFGEGCDNNTFGDYCYSNTFGDDCCDNTFGGIFNNNTFGNECHDNTFGNWCHSNTFGNECHDNTFEYNCHDNIFGDSCYDNTFGNSCDFNTFGDTCYGNTFGNNCYSNTFENLCYTITFGNNCSRNTFGIGCYHNTFGDDCYYNTFRGSDQYATFGNWCTHNTFKGNCNYNTFGTNCDHNTLGNDCQYITFGSDCQYITFGTASETIDYCRYNIIDNGCSYLYINSADTTATGSNYLQNVHIHLGVKGSSSENRRTIEVPNRNLHYSTTILAPGSKEIILDEE